MHRLLTALRATLCVGLASAACASASAAPLSNQEFAAQVRTLRAEIARQPARLESAALLCTHLPAHRAADEPQCVALRLHLRASATAASRTSTWLGCTRSALSSTLDALAALVDGAA